MERKQKMPVFSQRLLCGTDDCQKNALFALAAIDNYRRKLMI